jgi:hypothetical protein
MVFSSMVERLPIDSVTLSKLMDTPAVIRIVNILDITSLSILELFEYDVGMGDIIYSMANGVITYDMSAMTQAAEESQLGVPPNPHLYNAFVRRKVKLTEIGLYILESLKGDRFERRSSDDFQHQPSYTDPRHPTTIS